MALSPILTGVGVAAGAVVTGAARALGNGLSFAAQVGKPPEAKPVAEPQPAPEKVRDELVKQLRERLEERLKAAGIDLSHAIVLEASPSGSLRVMNDHPQWRAIEQVLGEDESFASSFAQIQAAVVDTGVDPHSARDLRLELSGGQARVLPTR